MIKEDESRKKEDLNTPAGALFVGTCDALLCSLQQTGWHISNSSRLQLNFILEQFTDYRSVLGVCGRVPWKNLQRLIVKIAAQETSLI